MRRNEEAEYTVTWTVQVSAKSPGSAARKALAMQRDYTSTATVFNVTPPEGDSELPAEVDLSEGTIKWEGHEPQALYYTQDGQPVVLLGVYWDNNLDLVRVTRIGDHTEVNYSTGAEITWHRADRIVPGRGHGGTYDGSRLAVRNPFDGTLAPEAARDLKIPCTFEKCTGVYSPARAGQKHQDGSVSSGWSFSPAEGDVPVHDHSCT